MTSIYTNLTIIIPAAAQALAQGLCVAAAGEAGAGMFTTGLSATGEAPATHYISSGAVEAKFAAILPITSVEQAEEEPVITKTTGNLDAVMGIVVDSGASIPEAVITNLFDQLDVSSQDPFNVTNRLGLQFIRTDSL